MAESGEMTYLPSNEPTYSLLRGLERWGIERGRERGGGGGVGEGTGVPRAGENNHPPSTPP